MLICPICRGFNTDSVWVFMGKNFDVLLVNYVGRAVPSFSSLS
jgi:hypothetical protein